MFNIIEKRRWYFLISLILMGISIILLVLSTVRLGWPLLMMPIPPNDTLFVLTFDEPVQEEAIRAVFADYGLTRIAIQQVGAPTAHTWQVRTRAVADDEAERILVALEERVGKMDRDSVQVSKVRPSAGNELTPAAWLAPLTAGLIVVVLTWLSFQSVPHAFRYGVCVIAGLIHNLHVVFGFTR